MLDSTSTEAAPASATTDHTPAPAAPAPAPSPAAANTTEIRAPVGADGTVKVEVTQKPEPTPEEARAADRAELTAKVKAAIARSRGEANGQNGALRGEKGKFASPNPAPAADAKPGHNNPPEETPKEATKPDDIPVPASWSKEQRAHWDKIPTEARQYILNKDKEVARAFTATGQRYKQLEGFVESKRELLETVSKYDDVFKSWGMRSHEGIRNLIETAQRLQSDPKGEIQRLAAESGLDLAAFAAEQIDPSTLPPDPRLADANMEISRLRRELQQRDTLRNAERGERETAQAAQRQQQAAEVFGEVREWFDSYETAKPHFNAVAEDMADIYLPSMIRKHGRTQQAIDKAYEAAVAANPQIREALITSQMAEAQKKRDAEARRIAEAAKAANAVNVQGGVSNPAAMSTRQYVLGRIREARNAAG